MPDDFSLQGISDAYGQGNIWQSDEFQPALQAFANTAGFSGDLFGDPYNYQAEAGGEGGPYMQTYTSRSLNPELLSALSGYSFKPTGENYLGMFKNNQLVSNQRYGSQDSWFDKLAMAGIPMALSAGFGGGLSGLFGGGMFGGAAGYGLANAGMSDFMGGDAAKGFLSGAIGGGLSNAGSFSPSNLAGIENKTLGSMFNKGVGSAVGTLASGGSGSDALKSGLTSAAITGGNSLGQQGMSLLKDTFTSLLSPSESTYASNPAMSASYPPGGYLPNGMEALQQAGITPEMSYAPPGTEGYSPVNVMNNWMTGESVPQKQIQEVGATSGLPTMFSNVASNLGNFAANHAGDLASMLYGFYNNRRQQQALGSQASSLQGLYGQNSPYAQQLRATLAAKAAQQGKRSNIAGRETQLQAALADKAASMAPTLMQLNQARGSLGNQNMNMLLQGANKMGLFNGLGSLFGNNTYSNGGYNLTGVQNPYGSDIAFNGWQ